MARIRIVSWNRRLPSKHDTSIVLSGWLSLAGFVAGLPFRQTRNRARKLLIASEQVCAAIPTSTIERVLGPVSDEIRIVMKAVESKLRNCSLFKLCTLSAIVAVRKPRRILEIGTYDGRSALSKAASIPQTGKLYTLNLPADYTSNKADSGIDELLLEGLAKQGEKLSLIAGTTIAAIVYRDGKQIDTW